VSQRTQHNWDNDLALKGIINLIAVLADNKYHLGRALSEWAVGAPSLENSVGCAAIAQEELGHCRAIYPLLEELAWAGAPTPLENKGESRERLYCVSFLEKAPSTWSQMVSGLLLIDSAMLTLVESLKESSYEKLARRIARIPAEERFHMQFAEGRVRELARVPEGHSQLAVQIDRLLPETLCWFGPPGEPGVETLVRDGLLEKNSEELRAAYLARLCPLLLEVGFRIDATWDLATQTWTYEELPWERWNPLQRRLETGVTTPR
jgi:1,2-phenylacetyl-CoA epoxidase catalytic subunit